MFAVSSGGGEEFEGYRLVQSEIVGAIDLPHPAASEEAYDAVASAEDVAGREARVIHATILRPALPSLSFLAFTQARKITTAGGSVLKDLRHALRLLLRAKGWTAVVVISLALGIGANTALFSAVNGLLLTSLPIAEPDTLVRLRYAGKNDAVTSSSDYGQSNRDAGGLQQRTTFSYAVFQQFVADNRTMSDLVACAPYGRVNVVVDGTADIANGFISTGNYYRMFELQANPGRTIAPDDDRPGAPPVAVISAKYWRSRFGADPKTIGKVVTVNNVPLIIVGVIAPTLVDAQSALSGGPDIAVPLALDGQLAATESKRLSQPTNWWLQVMGRLKPGVTAAQVQANLEAVFRQTARAGLDQYLGSLSETDRSTVTNRSRTNVPMLRVDSGSHGFFDARESDLRAVTILSVVVALVLLIVCANVANLLLSRALTRQKEISVRLSIGATRARLVRQLLTESVLLAAIGGSLGILVGYWGQQLLPGSAGQPAALDWRVLAFVMTVTVATGVVFGIAPALRATGVDLNAALKENSRSVAGSRSILTKSLLVVQVAVSLVLLVGAGLFVRTLQNLRRVDVGFNTRNLVIFSLNPALNGYDEARAAAYYRDVVSRLEAVPGVRAAALSNVAMLSGSVNSTSIFVAGRSYGPGAQDSINRVAISPRYFDTMEMRLVEGRGFTARDDDKAPKVVVINETAARQYFPNQRAIGQRFGSSVETASQLEIVGVLRDTKYNSVRDAVPPTMYVPYMQGRLSFAVVQVRTAGEPMSAVGAIREALRHIDPAIPMSAVSTQTDQIERRLVQEKTFAQAYTLFGALAVLLASIGLFGVMSYNVARRTNEIGIRIALGAQRPDVLRLVMTESMGLVVAGIAIGLAVAAAASRFVASLLFGLAPTDLATMVIAMTIMLIVSALAGYLPARRAVRVDPMVALHYE
jgi:predicted permease